MIWLKAWLNRRKFRKAQRKLTRYFRENYYLEDDLMDEEVIGRKSLRRLVHTYMDDGENGKHFARTKGEQVIIEAAAMIDNKQG